jgi:thiol:disulfide interchange protein DsbD
MIPILSGIIVAQGNNMNVKKAFVLSLVYVLAMALTYTVVGVLAGLFGSNLQAAFQTPWILFSFAFIFVLLSLSMFGFYELQLPSSWQTKLTKTSEGQTGLVGVAVMGLLSALIVGPCVAAPLAGALIYIGQTGDALLGGVALFSLSIGMGVPLLIIGTSAGKFMPKPGAWMEAIKYIFGVMLLGVAIWMLSRVVPAQVTMILWSLLLIVSAIYMGALEPMQQGIANVKKMIKAIGFVMLVYGLFLLVGAFTGAKHPFDPLEKLGSSTITVTGGDTTEMSEEVVFTRVGSLDELHKMIKQSDQKVMLDFYADWCVSCKEMEEYVFNDPRVREKLSEYTLLQVDVTRNNAADKEILKYFGLYGPPTVLFFGTDNEEIKSMRIVGEVSTSEFISYLDELEEF